MFHVLQLTYAPLSPLFSTMWIDALQKKADEETAILKRLTSDWQNYSRVLSAIKSNISSTSQTMRFLQNSIMIDQQRMAMSFEVIQDLTQQVKVVLKWAGTFLREAGLMKALLFGGKSNL